MNMAKDEDRLKAEGAWNYCADDFLDLARQLEADR